MIPPKIPPNRIDRVIQQHPYQLLKYLIKYTAVQPHLSSLAQTGKAVDEPFSGAFKMALIKNRVKSMTKRGGIRKGAGRPVGARNLRSLELVDRLQALYPDWCPVVQMAAAAQDESLDMQTRLNCAEKVAAYIYPKPSRLQEDRLKDVTPQPGLAEMLGLLPSDLS